VHLLGHERVRPKSKPMSLAGKLKRIPQAHASELIREKLPPVEAREHQKMCVGGIVEEASLHGE